MNENTLDPKRQKLIAYLYGELSTEEERDFERLLETDHALRAEWEEVKGTQGVMREWKLADPEPRFVFLETQEDSGSGRPRGIRERLSGLFSPAWGFGFAAASMAILVLAGFRVDHVENGLAFRFGPPSPVLEGMGANGVSLDGVSPIRSGNDGTVRAVPASATGAPLTRADLNGHASDVMHLVSAALFDYETKKGSELAFVLQSFYEDLRLQQRREYEELRSQIDGVGLGLFMEQNRTTARLESLVEQGSNPPPDPLSPPLNQKKDN